MMVSYVMPCFASPLGHLRSKAVWVAGVFCDTAFPDGTNQGPTYMAFFQRVRRGLGFGPQWGLGLGVWGWRHQPGAHQLHGALPAGEAGLGV